tara:strand:- start:664 stop:1242 length:579 start_codon:yes stop_codon:yes gene_type:complete
MAITKGVNIGCADIQGAGGIRYILIRSWITDDEVTYLNTATTHSITTIKVSGGGDATWYMYEFKNQLPSLSVSASKENGSTSYDCSLEFMMPDMDDGKGARLQALMDTCTMVMVIGNNGKNYVFGASQKYANEKAITRNQTYASMTGAEGATGAAYNDDNGWTVTLGAKQWEAPRIYSGIPTLYVTNDTATT